MSPSVGGAAPIFGSESNSQLKEKLPSGTILPPPDVREIVDKTASFVARNGYAFEDRIREKEATNAKFAFLNPFDPFHKYYQYQIEQSKAGNAASIKSATSQAPARPVQKPVPTGPKEPEPFHFSDRVPPVSAMDMDVLKLTAQYTAVKGRSFSATLSQREARNFQFDFLKSNHSLHSYFNALVSQYSAILAPPKDLENRLQQVADNKYIVLDRAKERAEWQRVQESRAKKEKEKQERDAVTFAQIDWHDYVIVETVEFTEADEHSDLPPPTNLKDLQTATLEQKTFMASYADANYAIEEAPPDYVEQGPQTGRTTSIPAARAEQPKALHESDEDRAIRERKEAEQRARMAQQSAQQVGDMKIKADYKPRASGRAQAMQVCPRCNQAIPSTEIEEHMRIEGLDPKWKEQKQLEASRRANTNLSNDVAANIKRLASGRSDIFDSKGKSLTPEEEERRKKIATDASWGR